MAGTIDARLTQLGITLPDAPTPAGNYVPFVINWGQQTGATTPRLLSHICRRGEIASRDIGLISMGPRASSFEVGREVAEAFERKVAKPDTRDPELRITRDRTGGLPRGPRSSRAHPSGGARPASGRPPWKKRAHGSGPRQDRFDGTARPARPKKQKK